MPRKPRKTHAGIYHVMARAPLGVLLFRDEHDFSRFETEVRRIVSDACICIAACALDMHYHLLLQVEDDVITRALHLLNSRYAAVYKARHEWRGHIFAERYNSVLVESDEQLMNAFRYIARNPVAAGLCEKPQDWLWSSYRCAIGLEGRFAFADPSVVLSCFDGSIEQLRDYVETPWESDKQAGPGPALRGLAPL